MADKQQIVLIQDAIDDEMGVPPNVYLPPMINGKKTRAVSMQTPISVSDNIVRINNEGDPIGMLLALANGQPVPTYIVTEAGECKTVYETATLAQRISITKWLGDRAMPKVSVNLRKDIDDDWDATLRNATVRDGDESLQVLDGEPG